MCHSLLYAYFSRYCHLAQPLERMHGNFVRPVIYIDHHGPSIVLPAIIVWMGLIITALGWAPVWERGITNIFSDLSSPRHVSWSHALFIE